MSNVIDFARVRGHDGDTFICQCGTRVHKGNYQRHYVCVDEAVRRLARQLDELRLRTEATDPTPSESA